MSSHLIRRSLGFVRLGKAEILFIRLEFLKNRA